MARVRTTTLASVTLLTLAACGSTPAATATRPSSPATTVAPPAPTGAAVSPTQAAVTDFAVVAYQGDQVFGGHQGRFSAAFAAGRPVVLLYFAGL
jgi:hypothetical protein